MKKAYLLCVAVLVLLAIPTVFAEVCQDQGNDPFLAHATIIEEPDGFQGWNWDYCINEGQGLIETSCLEGPDSIALGETQYSCSAGCFDGACSADGEATLVGSTTETEEETLLDTTESEEREDFEGCTDSDGGTALQVQGEMQSADGLFVDTCYEDVLVEYSCAGGLVDEEGNTIHAKRYRCVEGCSAGACAVGDVEYLGAGEPEFGSENQESSPTLVKGSKGTDLAQELEKDSAKDTQKEPASGLAGFFAKLFGRRDSDKPGMEAVIPETVGLESDKPDVSQAAGALDLETTAETSLTAVNEEVLEEGLEYCTDTDGGLELRFFGQVEVYGPAGYNFHHRYRQLEDYCNEEGRLIELYCAGDTLHSGQYSCQEGFVCQEGACVIPGLNEDEEGGDLSDFDFESQEDAELETSMGEFAQQAAPQEELDLVQMSNGEQSSLFGQVGNFFAGLFGGSSSDTMQAERDSCEDSESGVDRHVAGIATGRLASTLGDFVAAEASEHADSCISSELLAEAVCGPDGLVTIQEVACQEGEYCSQGACQEVLGCEDSDGIALPDEDLYSIHDYREDRDAALEAAGTMTVEFASGSVALEDTCTGFNTIVEHSCEIVVSSYVSEESELRVPRADEFTCSAGNVCVDGACQQPSGCVETDAGQDPMVRGITVGTIQSSGLAVTRRDSCNGNMVFEYYCSASGHVAENGVACPDGLTCRNGACA